MTTTVEEIILRVTGDVKSGESSLDRIAQTLRRFGAVLTTTSDGTLIAFAKLGQGGIVIEALESKFRSAMKAFGQDADQMLSTWRAASKGMLDESDIMAKANYLMLTGIPVSEIEWMLKAASNAALASGKSMDEMFDKVATGVARQSRLMLADVGIVVRATDANKEWAAEMGGAVKDMDTHTKQLAFMAEAREAAAKAELRFGSAVDSNATILFQSKAALQDAKESIQKLFIPVAVAAAKIMLTLTAAWRAIPQPVKQAVVYLLTAAAVLGAIIGPALTLMGILPWIGAAVSAMSTIAPVILAVGAAIGVLVGLIATARLAWQRDWGGIQQAVQKVVDVIRPWIQSIGYAVTYWGGVIRLEVKRIIGTVQTLIEPALARIRALLGDGAGLAEFMSYLRDVTNTLGSTVTALLESIRMVLSGDAANAWRPLADAGINIMTLIVMGWQKWIKAAVVYGSNLVTNFANGIITAARTVLTAAATYIGNILSRFLESRSPPKEGPLAGIVTWGMNLMNTYLRGFALADFGILRDSLGPLRQALDAAVGMGDLSKADAGSIFRDVRVQVAGLIEEYRKTGTISTQVLDGIAKRLGKGGEEYTKYISLMLQHQGALDNLKTVEKEVADAEAKGFVPQELKDKLNAAKEQAQSTEDAMNWQKEYLAAIQDTADIQQQMVDSLKEAADAMQSLKDLKIPPVTVEMEPIPAMLPAAMPAAQLTPFEGLGGIFSQEFEKVKGQVTSWLAGLPGQVRAVVAQLPGILAGMWGQAKAQSPFLAGITEDFEKVKTWLTINWPLIQAIVMTAGVVISSVIGAVRDVFVNDVSPKLVEAFDKLKKAIGDLGITWPDVWNAIKRAVGIVAVIIGAIILGLVGIIVGIVNGIALVLEFVTSRIELFKGAWNETFAGIGTFFIGLWDTIRSILTGDWPAAWENLKLMLSGAWTFFKGLLLLIYLTVTSIFGTILAFLLGFVEGFVNFFKNLYDRLVGKESSTIPVMLQGIYETITTKITEVITWLGTQVQAFLDAGKNLIGGFIQGISSKWQDLKAWFRGKFSEIPEWARKIFGIGSPSKLFQYYGEMIQKGLLVGMDSGGVESAMRSMVPNVSGAGTGQQIVVVQIPSLALPGIRDGRDADGLIAQLLSDTFEHAALKSLVPGGIG